MALSHTTILFTIIIFRKCYLPTYIITFTHETDGEPDLLPSEHPDLSASIILETISGKSDDLCSDFVRPASRGLLGGVRDFNEEVSLLQTHTSINLFFFSFYSSLIPSPCSCSPQRMSLGENWAMKTASYFTFYILEGGLEMLGRKGRCLI